LSTVLFFSRHVVDTHPSTRAHHRGDVTGRDVTVCRLASASQPTHPAAPSLAASQVIQKNSTCPPDEEKLMNSPGPPRRETRAIRSFVGAVCWGNPRELLPTVPPAVSKLRMRPVKQRPREPEHQARSALVLSSVHTARASRTRAAHDVPVRHTARRLVLAPSASDTWRAETCCAASRPCTVGPARVDWLAARTADPVARLQDPSLSDLSWTRSTAHRSTVSEGSVRDRPVRQCFTCGRLRAARTWTTAGTSKRQG
jgi:hypothetical protein